MNNNKTKVVHSKSKTAWKVVNEKLGGKYEIARVPYVASPDLEVNEKNKQEALEHAEFISMCFNSVRVLKGKLIDKTAFTPTNKNHLKIEILGEENWIGNQMKLGDNIEIVCAK